MKKWFAIFFLFVSTACFFSCVSYKEADKTLAQVHEDTGTQMISGFSRSSGLNYLVTQPPDSREAYPLIIFLHSLEERGRDPSLLYFNLEGEGKGLAWYAYNTDDFPFMTLSPLSPKNTAFPLIEKRVKQLLDEIILTYPVDPERIYITGVSMGGMGVWEFCMSYPDAVSAAAPISGGTYPFVMKNKIDALQNIPFMAFHDRGDTHIPVSDEKDTVDKVKAAGGEIEYILSDTGKHYIHEMIFDKGDLFAWFLEH